MPYRAPSSIPVAPVGGADDQLAIGCERSAAPGRRAEVVAPCDQLGGAILGSRLGETGSGRADHAAIRASLTTRFKATRVSQAAG